MAKYKRVFTSCHRGEKGIPSWSLDWDEDTEEDLQLLGFGYGIIHIHSLFGRVRQVLLETEEGIFYDIPKDKFEEIMALPSMLDMEVALADRCINGLTVREDS